MVGMQRAALQTKLAARRRQIGSNVQRQNQDREYRQLLFNEAAIAKILEYDEEEQSQMTSNQTRYLQIALVNYRR